MEKHRFAIQIGITNDDFRIDGIYGTGLFDESRLEYLQCNNATWVRDWRAGSCSSPGSDMGYTTCFALGSSINTEETGFILNCGEAHSV